MLYCFRYCLPAHISRSRAKNSAPPEWEGLSFYIRIIPFALLHDDIFIAEALAQLGNERGVDEAFRSDAALFLLAVDYHLLLAGEHRQNELHELHLLPVFLRQPEPELRILFYRRGGRRDGVHGRKVVDGADAVDHELRLLLVAQGDLSAHEQRRGVLTTEGPLLLLAGAGSGKTTVSDYLAAQGVPVQKITFPDYASDSSALVRMYLAGQFGQHPDDVNAYAASSFYAVDRYASYKTSWGSFYQQGGVIVADRYTTSNAVHQCSKLPPEQWEEFLHWLFDYEFHLLGLPAPDCVIYLQVDPAVSQKLMTQRYHGDESKKDVHEKDVEYLARSRRAAEFCAAHLGWQTVPCTCGDGMRSVEEIGQEVRRRVDAALAE